MTVNSSGHNYWLYVLGWLIVLACSGQRQPAWAESGISNPVTNNLQPQPSFQPIYFSQFLERDSLIAGQVVGQIVGQSILGQPPIAPPSAITVTRFEVVGSTLFPPEKLAEVTAQFTNRTLTTTELIQAADAVTRLYTSQGYVNSGAFIPTNQSFQPQGGVVKIQVLEGSLESIQVKGTQRLDPGYIESRLAIAADPPLNINRVMEALQLLKLDPLIANISAELSASPTPGKSILNVQVSEAKTFRAQLSFDNSRSPGVGSEQRGIQVSQANLLGLGDSISLDYTNTDGSNGLTVSYNIPLSPYNTSLRLLYATTSSRVIETPFSILDITAASRIYELSVRQPVLRTPSQEIAVGMTVNHQETETALLGFPFPLAIGANDRGETRISALRFFQEYSQRGSEEVFAAYSQFSLGLNLLGDTINATPPDSRFFSWRGQAQYIRLLAPDTLAILRTDLQLADRALVPLEQISFGGPSTVRGYRRDFVLGDNGALISAEFRIPVLRVPEVDGLLQLTPFLDFGTVWNTGRADLQPNTLFAGGFGLLWRQGDYLTARFQWGIPFISVPATRQSWQENGLYFSIVYTPFTF
ncbi:hypothetical protein BST81_15855 [Leptolyngbya sp. 'hensonii']|uniref:ShlB/FhaC/HecB family hemolysin secretion/activation protein n=1 Tax=Leptolyngbya sp. 'hensonii' TaxID=1922337 RepID=UPI00094FE470|nr:ShlB/FhaC/HecB family hemolysin secretion/activation protein [Leptolyngbya sp. 'hensonii']OLP17290.1 hypothetical protein BST81_15855 [Leptolyngbya sp. 'hensonii']